MYIFLSDEQGSFSEQRRAVIETSLCNWSDSHSTRRHPPIMQQYKFKPTTMHPTNAIVQVQTNNNAGPTIQQCKAQKLTLKMQSQKHNPSTIQQHLCKTQLQYQSKMHCSVISIPQTNQFLLWDLNGLRVRLNQHEQRKIYQQEVEHSVIEWGTTVFVLQRKRIF